MAWFEMESKLYCWQAKYMTQDDDTNTYYKYYMVEQNVFYVMFYVKAYMLVLTYIFIRPTLFSIQRC